MTSAADTTAQKPATPPDDQPRRDFDPDEFRMTVGEHLEELRHRILIGLAGFFVAAIVCLIFGKQMLAIFCEPLVAALQQYDLNPQLFSDDPTDAFMSYIQISLICAAAVASPWMLFQLWKFVATGLYTHERKMVTRYVPMSLALLISGMLFVYYIVLPLTLRFFILFTISIPIRLPAATPLKGPTTGPTTQPTFVQATPTDPAHAADYQIWFNTTERRLKVMVAGTPRNIPFGSDALMATHFQLPVYITLVLRLLLTFGLCFQLPLVVMALARVGIVQVAQLKEWRRYVYFGMTILAAAVSPGDVITATIALLVPLIFLYELGIFMAALAAKRAAEAAGEE
jgi:sec-independent protein translocase protein TatC